MSLPDPRFRPQLDGTKFAGQNCSAASGAMALDAYTHGAIAPSPDDIRRLQSDQVGGIGLDDVAEAWRHYGQRFDYARVPWATIVDRLSHGDGVVIQGDYDRVGVYSSQKSFLAGHAMYASRLTSPTEVLVFDPLASRARVWPLSVLKLFYAAGPQYLAGWGHGVYVRPTKATHATNATRVRLRTGPNTSRSIVTTLARVGSLARVEGTVTGSWYKLSNGRRSNQWLVIVARLGRRLSPPLYSAALLWRHL